MQRKWGEAINPSESARQRLVALGEDVCEWCPGANRAAMTGDPWHAYAEVMIGAKVEWRLCARCAALPRFARFRIRRPIAKRG